MPKFSNLRIANFLIIAIFSLTSCKTIENLPGGNAREISPDPRERVKKNLEEGRGFRLDEQTPGSGLGLNIVKDIVEIYKGRVWLENSKKLGGLEVFIILPISLPAKV